MHKYTYDLNSLIVLTGSVEPHITSAIMGIAIASTAVVAFIVGILAGITIYHCICKHRSHQSLKSKTSFHQQPQSVLSSNPLPQTGPGYGEVVKLRKNVSYELTKTGIEMKANEAYQSTQH